MRQLGVYVCIHVCVCVSPQVEHPILGGHQSNLGPTCAPDLRRRSSADRDRQRIRT
jgi:hypothetical protein